MKKLVAFLLALVLMFSLCLVACEKPDNGGDVPGGNPDDIPGENPGETPGGGDDNPGEDKPSGGTTTPNEFDIDMNIGVNQGEFESFEKDVGANERQLRIFWREAEHDYSDNDIWLWLPNAAGQLYPFVPCSYGGVVVVNVPAGTSEVGFIIRANATIHEGTTWTDATKVYDGDRFVILSGDITDVYLTGKNPYQFTSEDGGKTLQIIREVTKMSITTLSSITYKVIPTTTIETLEDIKVTCDGNPVKIKSISSLGNKASTGTIVLEEEIDLSKTYQVTIKGFNCINAFPLEVFDTAEFISNYTYDGNDLGAVVDETGTTFKLWAPTASKVVLNLFPRGNDCNATSNVEMVLGEKGVWSYRAEGVGHGTYYTYSVTTCNGEQEAVDPYARAAGVNGERGMVVDLAQTNPDGFAQETYLNGLTNYGEAILWEVHVRDFSNMLTQSQYKGKYLAFTETGLTNSSGLPAGVDYIKALGATHIHLLPVYDYKTVDEANLDTPQFNWGYDPQNYNVPEGSYSTDPYNGEVRIKEFKQMVQALHAQGLGVVMDVVYNHTADGNSNLNKVVPYYYYRYNSDGTNSSGSGCGNDTASERVMYRKYMVDSVSYWMSEYKLDGFRFDLMGLHDLETMQEIEKAVHALNPNAIIYGEAWTMTTATSAQLATQPNIKKITVSDGAAGGIAVFNDAIRDGLKGSVFTATEGGYINGKVNFDTYRNVRFGVSGGTQAGCNYTVNNFNVINYMSAHDNHSLWDKITITTPNATVEERMAMNRMGAAIVMASKGTPFMQAGEEMLRTKPNEEVEHGFDHNSYKSNDQVNNIKWDALTPDSNEYAMMQYYAGLIQMRKAVSEITDLTSTYSFPQVEGDYLICQLASQGSVKLVMVANPHSTPFEYTLPAGEWSLLVNGTQAGAIEISSHSGTITVDACSTFILIKK